MKSGENIVGSLKFEAENLKCTLQPHNMLHVTSMCKLLCMLIYTCHSHILCWVMNEFWLVIVKYTCTLLFLGSFDEKMSTHSYGICHEIDCIHIKHFLLWCVIFFILIAALQNYPDLIFIFIFSINWIW